MKPARVANDEPSTGTLIAPCTCPAACRSAERRSSTVTLSLCVTCLSGSAAGAPTKGPRFSSTTCAVVGGRGVDTDAEMPMNSSRSACASAAFVRLWSPIVDDRSGLIAAPQSEPATCPGYTSTASGSCVSRCSEWNSPSAPSRASTARSGRAASPTNNESPVNTSRSSTTNAQCSGRWPGVWSTRMGTDPTSMVWPSSSGSNGNLGSARGWTETGTPCSSASRPCPETWSACVWVSSTRTIRRPSRRAASRYGSIA